MVSAEVPVVPPGIEAKVALVDCIRTEEALPALGITSATTPVAVAVQAVFCTWSENSHVSPGSITLSPLPFTSVMPEAPAARRSTVSEHRKLWISG